MTETDLEKLDAAVLEAMTRIPSKCKSPYPHQTRKFPLDAVTVACVDWELIDQETRRDIRDRKYYENKSAPVGESQRRNKIAMSLRRLLADHRVEKLPSGKRRDQPRWRPLPILDSLAKMGS